MAMPIDRNQRFNKNSPCPICGGHTGLPTGHGSRCFGFISEDKEWVHCTREEYAGNIQANNKTNTYAHHWYGACKCGTEHNPGGGLIDFTTLPVVAIPAENTTHTGSNGTQNGSAQIAHLYNYVNLSGEIVSQTIRYEPKTFKQRRPEGNGWVWNLDGIELVPYQLPQLVNADPAHTVYIVEGEKDVDTLLGNGFVATCNPMGAGKWKASFNQYLTGRRVVIIADKDAPGRKHAQTVAESLTKIAKTVDVMEMDNGKDVTEWFELNDNKETANGHFEKFVKEATHKEQHRFHAYELDRLPPVEWLLEPYLQTNCQTMLVGETGTGKTFFGIELAMTVALTDNVLYIACEDPSQYPARVKAWLDYHKPKKCNFYLETLPVELMNMTSVAKLIENNRDISPRLVVIDTFHAATESADEISAKDMGTVLAAAREIQRAFTCTVLHVHHMNKSGTTERGHSSIKAAMRIVMRLTVEGDGVKLEWDKMRIGTQPEPQIFSWVEVGEARVMKNVGNTPVSDNVTANDRKILLLLSGDAYKDDGLSRKELLDRIPQIKERTMEFSLRKLLNKGLLRQPAKRGNYYISEAGIAEARPIIIDFSDAQAQDERF